VAVFSRDIQQRFFPLRSLQRHFSNCLVLRREQRFLRVFRRDAFLRAGTGLEGIVLPLFATLCLSVWIVFRRAGILFRMKDTGREVAVLAWT